MKIFGSIVIASLALLFVSFAAEAQNACVQVCQQKNRRDVQICNYPAKEPQALKECLATVRSNFDACMQGCR
jgi:hypothetical protein